VVAIADPDLAAAEARAARYGIPAVFASVEEMLDAVPIDALDVAAPREFHVPICRAAAARKIHAILCQKPLAPTLSKAKALVAELGAGVRLMVHENWRFRPHYRQMHAWIRDGHVGDIRSVIMTILSSGLLPDETGALPALVRQPMLAGLERMLLMEVLIHHVDALRFLLGPLTLAGATLGKRCSEIRGEDRAALFLTGPQGEAVALVGDFMAHGHPPLPFDHLEILGTKGSILLDGNQLRLAGETQQNVTLDLAANYKASYAGAISHFLDRLADGAPFETSPDDNLKTLAIVEAAYAASN
jgi:predicted dehydrogenase